MIVPNFPPLSSSSKQGILVIPSSGLGSYPPPAYNQQSVNVRNPTVGSAPTIHDAIPSSNALDQILGAKQNNQYTGTQDNQLVLQLLIQILLKMLSDKDPKTIQRPAKPEMNVQDLHSGLLKSLLLGTGQTTQNHPSQTRIPTDNDLLMNLLTSKLLDQGSSGLQSVVLPSQQDLLNSKIEQILSGGNLYSPPLLDNLQGSQNVNLLDYLGSGLSLGGNSPPSFDFSNHLVNELMRQNEEQSRLQSQLLNSLLNYQHTLVAGQATPPVFGKDAQEVLPFYSGIKTWPHDPRVLQVPIVHPPMVSLPFPQLPREVSVVQPGLQPPSFFIDLSSYMGNRQRYHPYYENVYPGSGHDESYPPDGGYYIKPHAQPLEAYQHPRHHSLRHVSPDREDVPNRHGMGHRRLPVEGSSSPEKSVRSVGPEPDNRAASQESESDATNDAPRQAESKNVHPSHRSHPKPEKSSEDV